MDKIIKNPYLPIAKVKSAFAGSAAYAMIRDFASLGMELIVGAPENVLQMPLRGHIDMAVTPLTNGEYFVSKNQKNIIDLITKNSGKIFFASDYLKTNYPFDSLYNCVIIGESLICNSKSVSKEIIAYAKEKNKKIINVNQGYTKCSVCPITKNAVITDDSCISTMLKENGFDVLFINKGSIVLDGYNYGFIGGSASMISDKELLFFGDYKTHSNSSEIVSFLSNYGIHPISLNNNKLTDIGSIIPFTESWN